MMKEKTTYYIATDHGFVHFHRDGKFAKGLKNAKKFDSFELARRFGVIHCWPDLVDFTIVKSINCPNHK